MAIPGARRSFDTQEITDILREAIDITESLEPPEDLRQSTFAAALNLVGNMSADTSIAVPHMRMGAEKLL